MARSVIKGAYFCTNFATSANENVIIDQQFSMQIDGYTNTMMLICFHTTADISNWTRVVNLQHVITPTSYNIVDLKAGELGFQRHAAGFVQSVNAIPTGYYNLLIPY